MRKARREHSYEFKRDAGPLLGSRGGPMMQVATEAGISASKLRNWRTMVRGRQRVRGRPCRVNAVRCRCPLGHTAHRGGITLVGRFSSVRVRHGEASLPNGILPPFVGRADPFGGLEKVVPVVLSAVIPQVIGSGLNPLGTTQHLATTLRDGTLGGVMAIR